MKIGPPAAGALLDRADVTGHAPGSVEEFLDSVLPYPADAYPVELVVLAVRKADSPQATALRYARSLQISGTNRVTTRSGGDGRARPSDDAASRTASPDQSGPTRTSDRCTESTEPRAMTH